MADITGCLLEPIDACDAHACPFGVDLETGVSESIFRISRNRIGACPFGVDLETGVSESILRISHNRIGACPFGVAITHWLSQNLSRRSNTSEYAPDAE
jgi:hypothetical protein